MSIKKSKRNSHTSHRALLEQLESRTLFNSYWVSPTGTDTDPGTQDAPWKTLQKASLSVAAGDTLTLNAGTYVGGITFSAPNLTIQAAPGANPVIAVPYSNKNILWSVRFFNTASGSTIRGIEISGGNYYALKFEDISNSSGASNILVDSCKLHDSGSDVIKLTPGCDNITIHNCEIYGSGHVDPTNGEGIDDTNGDYLHVQGCYIHNTADNGVYAKGGAIGVIIEQNRIDQIGYAGILLGQDTDTRYFDTTQDPKYYENINGIARNNIITNCKGAGIGAFAALNPNILNNTMINVAQSIQGGMFIADSTKRSVPTVNPVFLNNIVTMSGSRPMFDIRTGALSGTLTINNNRYFNTNSTPLFWDERIRNYKLAFAQWQTGIKGDTSSSIGNPMVDSTGHLLLGSPCIDAGTPILSVTNDYDGDPRPLGAGYDIGADEAG